LDVTRGVGRPESDHYIRLTKTSKKEEITRHLSGWRKESEMKIETPGVLTLKGGEERGLQLPKGTRLPLPNQIERRGRFLGKTHA